MKKKEAGMTEYIEEQKRKYGFWGYDGETSTTMCVVVPKKLEQEIVEITKVHKMTKSQFMRVAFWNEIERWQA